MKPGPLPASTPTLPMVLASFMAVARAASEVLAPRTISSNFITGAGEKKCRPSTWSGRDVTAAISSMSR